jgi:hypothetical protein
VREPGGMCEVVVVVAVVVVFLHMGLSDFYTLGYAHSLLFRAFAATVAKCKADGMFHETM